MKFATILGVFIFITVTAFSQQPVPKDSTPAYRAAGTPARETVRKNIKKMREDQSDSVRLNRSRQIAKRMSDSLALSQSQRTDILNINASLEQQKALVFKTDTIRDNITRELQRIEKQRDVLYRNVLTEKQFQTYEKSKTNLINPQPKGGGRN